MSLQLQPQTTRAPDTESGLDCQTDLNVKRLNAAGILTKLAIYFISFGVILLLTGGIRSVFFEYGINSRILVIIGTVTASLGIVYTLLALIFIKSLDLSPTVILNLSMNSETSLRRPGNQSSQSTVSSSVPFNGTCNDLKYLEPPPSYESTVTSSPRIINDVLEEPRQESRQDEQPPSFTSLFVKKTWPFITFECLCFAVNLSFPIDLYLLIICRPRRTSSSLLHDVFQ